VPHFLSLYDRKMGNMPDNNNENIEILAQKMLLGTITESEKIVLEKWYAENPSQTPDWQLHDDSKGLLEARLYQGIKQRITPVRRLFPAWAKLAAAASVLIFSSILLTIYFSSKDKGANKQYSIVGAEGHIRKVLLPDQSIVWLKGNSRLEYPARFSDSTRNVVLHGEALFEVAKDRKHPFIILAGNYSTRVVGTSFNIKENQKLQSFKLTVLTGKVLVSPIKNNVAGPGLVPSVMVTPGKEFESLNKISPVLVTTTQPSAKATVVQGTEYVMDFENTAFSEVKNRIEHKFDVTINSADAAYRTCALSADVTDQSLDNTLKVICAAIGARYTIMNNKITITGGGCN